MHVPLWRALSSPTSPFTHSLGLAYIVGCLRVLPHTQGSLTTHSRDWHELTQCPPAAWPKPPPGLSLTQTAPWRAKDGSVGSSIMPDEPVHGKMGACDENGYAHSVGEDRPRKGGCEDGFDAGVTSSRRCFGSTRPPSRVVLVEMLLATACIGVVREATRRSQQSREGGLWQQRLGSVCASGMRVGGRPRVG